MAGRLSEEMFQKEVTSSCIHDLDKVQTIAMRMVCEFGMGKRTGIVTWMCHDSDEPTLMLFSEVQRNDIYADVKEILRKAEYAARSIIESHGEQVKKLAEILIERKTVYGRELSELFRV